MKKPKNPKQNLTAKRVASLLKKPGRYRDAEVRGLLLVVGKWDKQRGKYVLGDASANWTLRYQSGKKERWYGLGPVSLYGVKEARERARDARRLVHDGHDPIDAKRAKRSAARLEAAKAISFEEAATAYIAANEASWKNAKHAAQWTATLQTYVYPVIGKLPVASIDTGLVLKCIEPIWQSKTETASRVRSRMKNILDWCGVREHRSRESPNPACWKGHLEHVLPAKRKNGKHFPALPYARVPEFLTDLAKREGIAARALEFTILVAARTGEVIGAKRSEFDLTAKTWTIPEGRMKGEREHKVPLSDRAVGLLRKLPHEKGNDFMFIGPSQGAGLSNMAMAALIDRINEARDRAGLARYVDPKEDNRDITVHGFRSSFRDWAAERTNYQNHIVEMALAHVIGDDVEASYRRGDLIAKRTRLMRDWARYCASTPSTGSNVVAIGSAG